MAQRVPVICEVCGKGHDGEDEMRNVRKEAPCYGKDDGHEYANGECIYCGQPQPGHHKEKRLKSFGESIT